MRKEKPACYDVLKSKCPSNIDPGFGYETKKKQFNEIYLEPSFRSAVYFTKQIKEDRNRRRMLA